MKPQSPFIQRFEELPNTLRVFPLSNAVLLPRGHLPLNIFEPRYLNMVRDSMQSNQLIGMIQPGQSESQSELFKVGCAGRITRYEEKSDGRIELVLTGVCRFEVDEELPTTRGYRLIVANWSKYETDFEASLPPSAGASLAFKSVLRTYLSKKKIDADWQVLDSLAIEDLANSLLSFLPLSAEDKQMLLEADNFANRLTFFTAILEGDGASTGATH